MKTSLKLHRKLRLVYANYNVFRFRLRKTFIGFDVANLFIQRVDKISLQLILKNNGASIGKDCDIETGLTFHNCKNYSNLSIGNNCHIGNNCFFDLRDKVVIGNNVVISMQCTFITHIDMNKSILSEKYPANAAPIIIEDNSYLGSGVQVLKGVVIGKETLVTSMSLVNKSLRNNCLIGGIPAKVLRGNNE